MKQYEYTPHGVCSRQITITLDDSGKIAALKESLAQLKK